ncbi:uncharacterized protein P884DRAFT_198354, partial [Thermothelomyces heterothallicus CBS 202.75]|uniref:uncharacterized protein n=1 Tax=Thermothelomyces heterothallicus CBS 202.75 TaxID=1149848 RepID=UPI0037445725
LLRNPMVEEFCKLYHKKTLAEVHTSLVNRDRIGLIIQKHRSIHYPLGSSRLAAAYEWQVKHKDQPDKYIQHFFDDGHNFVIICFFQQQVELFKKGVFESFELDMNYKHLSQFEDREVIWGTYSRQVERVIPLVRILTNSDSPEMYAYTFKVVFRLFELQYQFSIRWRHLHGSGLIGITIDQDYKALLGFTGYLYEIDPEHKPWIWHATRTVRLCHIHFQRGVATITGGETGDRGPDSDFARLMQLLECANTHDYQELCQAFLSHPQKSIRDWARHKQAPAIMAGLCRGCTDMPLSNWDAMQSHTNHIEVLHQEAYSWSGRYVNLLSCIRR